MNKWMLAALAVAVAAVPGQAFAGKKKKKYEKQQVKIEAAAAKP